MTWAERKMQEREQRFYSSDRNQLLATLAEISLKPAKNRSETEQALQDAWYESDDARIAELWQKVKCA